MKEICLKNTTTNQEIFSATFFPELGMNLAHLKKGDLDVIDQSSKKAFLQRFSGLGPLIGPHFFRMEEDLVVKPLRTDLFPHIQEVLRRGQKDPFSHGIARYVPWNYVHKGNTIEAQLSGNDRYQGAFLKDLEGYDFSMEFRACLAPDGLEISMSVEADRECVCGLHYYYALEQKKGAIIAPVQPSYNDGGIFKPIPQAWLAEDNEFLRFNLENFADYGFLPLFENASSWVLLETGSTRLRVSYQGDREKISCQIYSPKGADFVCIEPISAKNPRRLDGNKSTFSAKISIES